jgi:hypothetical protein
MMFERRAAPRTSARVYFNKYIDGHPHLCEALELSATGMLVRRIHEPDAERAAYAVELATGPLDGDGERLWLCASPVWSAGELEALRFVECGLRDQALLGGLLERLAA